MVATTTAQTLTHKMTGCLNRPLVRNILLLTTLSGLVLLFIAAYFSVDKLKQLQHFSHSQQQAFSLQNTAVMLARRRGLQAIIDSGETDSALLAEKSRMDHMLTYNLKPLLHNGQRLQGLPLKHADTLRDCLANDCFSKKTLAGEKAFELHTDYIKKLLQDAGNLLLTADKHSDILTDPFIPKSTQLIVDISFYAETAGQLRGRLSAYLSKENQLTPEPLQEVQKELEKRSLGFKELANDEIVQEMGLASYTARNHRHYLQLREYIAQITAGKASASGSKFFETATRFIEDLHFMREQLNQNLANRINRNIDLQNNQLVKIGVAAFVLFLVLIGLLLARFHAEHQKTKLRNLELSFLKKALDNHAIVSMTDAQGNITFVNEKFCAISGFESDELIGRNHRIINSGVHSSAFFKKLWDSVHNNNSWSGEVCNRKKTGELYWVFATVLPLFDDKNKLISIISVRTDITQQKQSEALLQKEKEKAEAANQAKSDFLANMSHEIRTPMNAIIGLTHLALRDSVDDKNHNYLNKIKLSANNLLDIINDILDFSKIEAGKIHIESIPFSLPDILKQVVDVSQVKANEKQLPICFFAPEDLVSECVGDPLRISQILLNLLSNAVKFTEKGHVTLDVQQSKLDDLKVKLTFSVIDSGIGISKEKQSSLFEAFTQEDSSTTRIYGGTGLGLSISQELARLMGSQLTVKSDQGEGSCFSFSVVLDQYHNSTQQRPLSELRAVYVDDDPVALAAVSRLFDAQGIKLHCFDNALKGYEFICHQAENPETTLDLVLVDQNMPDMNGTTLARKLNDTFAADLLPHIILLTGQNEHDLETIIKDQLFDAIWLKPVSASEMLDGLQDLFKGNRKGLSATLTAPINTSGIHQLLGGRVLIAEDNLINQEVITGLLEPYGLELTIVENGQEAIKAVKQNSYDLVLMDVQMPVMDGLEATRQICKLGLVKQPPIIAMTANAMESDRRDCLNAGMSDHISKPIDPARLQGMLYQWLKQDVSITALIENTTTQSAPHTASTEVRPTFIEGIDMSVAFASANQDKKLVQKLFSSFVDQYKDTNLICCTQDELARQLHTLKGLAGTLGMTELNILASALEQEHKKQGRIEPNKVELIDNEINRLVLVIKSSLEQNLAESTDIPPGSNDLTKHQPRLENEPHTRIDEIARRLKEELTDGDSDAQETALEFMLAMQETTQAQEAAQILELADSFDFDRALSILKTLKLENERK